MTDTEHDPASRDDTTGSGKSKPQSAADGGGNHPNQRDNGKAPEPTRDQGQQNAKENNKENDKQNDKESAEEKAGEETRKKRRPLIVTIGVVIVGLLIIAGLYYWLTTRNLESTDDAYTDGRAVTIAAQ